MKDEELTAQSSLLEIALPSWGFAQGGTRFGRFPMAGEPRTIDEKLEDAAMVHRSTPSAPGGYLAIRAKTKSCSHACGGWSG